MVFCLLLSLLLGNVWAALITMSHYLQKSLDAGMGVLYFLLDFSAAFDRVSQWPLIQIEIYLFRWLCAVHL